MAMERGRQDAQQFSADLQSQAASGGLAQSAFVDPNDPVSMISSYNTDFWPPILLQGFSFSFQPNITNMCFRVKQTVVFVQQPL